MLSNIDILEPVVKTKLNRIFHTNTEEIRSYIPGTVVYLYNKLIKKQNSSITSNINQQKDYFKHLFKLDNDHIIIQYIVAIVLFTLWINIGTPILNSRIHIT